MRPNSVGGSSGQAGGSGRIRSALGLAAVLPLLAAVLPLLAACAAVSRFGEAEANVEDLEQRADLEQPQAVEAPELPDMGPAPELTNAVWFNTAAPLRLAELRGQVVLLDMWTFGCINCQRVIPYLRQWHETYAGEGLVVIGNHYPEFDYERDADNVAAALERLNVPYPVAQDNDRATWGAYHNRYWPTLYLIDKHGHLRYTHIGEGAYAETEAAIQVLLMEPFPSQ